MAPGLLPRVRMRVVTERRKHAADRAGGKSKPRAWRPESRLAHRRRRDDAAPVLVVDDDVGSCQVMTATLERDGHRVQWTTDPVHALALVRAHDYALIVSDVSMPTMSGTALAAEAARCRPGLRTLLVTGLPDARVCAEAEAVGSVLLAKPVRIDVLSSTVRELMKPRAGASDAR